MSRLCGRTGKNSSGCSIPAAGFRSRGMLVEAVTVYLAQIARSKVPELDLSVDDLEVMLRFYACGMVGVLLQYMEKPNLNEEKLVIQMEKIITGKMFPGKHD